MLSRAILQHTPSSLRYIHTTSLRLAENNTGVFSRFNPWAKNDKDTSKKTEQETTTTTPTETISNVTFDVDFADKEEVQSWKTTTIMTEPEQIETSVHSVVMEHVKGINDTNWKDVSLNDDIEVKFKVIKDSIKHVGKEVPNMELNHISTVNDLVNFFQRKPTIHQTTIEQFFEENQSSLPQNLTLDLSNKK
ncbi:hypothetical protein BJ944DRAFT_169120 [Cunninghamella echinulata]|nr:hypothetical protein BJ944DRAFT_169120 [Cunninghamella echinulata]